MARSLILMLVGALLTVALFVGGEFYFRSSKIGFVRTSDLVQGFKGMKDAHSEYNAKVASWEEGLDSLANDYKGQMAELTKNLDELTVKEQDIVQVKVQNMEMELYQEVQRIQALIKQEDQRLTDQVFAKINDYVKEYGDANGYMVILGTNASGNVMYGSDAIDLTEETLDFMNQKYEGK